ncbi:deoxyribonuclease V [Oceanicoccus sp. KOV_DT_Chl]|uniref:deoxyribonuclease V n=1 Tax=Oceanicoccus sp. KOV_DT_Chl TaxID=1904639 RepID=UPI000C7B8FA1|nr:deoxyribonuclease V [Oceanicoccus sp. KOV_DT_Chl]
MKIQQLHSWDVTLTEAKAIQNELAAKISLHDDVNQLRFVAGTDIGFEDNFGVTRAAVVVLTFPELEIVEYQIAKRPTIMPYIPGYLSFRECPALLDAMEKLQQSPNIILCDGQGIAHPRRLGIASHLGLITGLPTIGVGKSRLIGKHHAVGRSKGDWQPLIDKGQTIGAALCSRDKTLPIYISAGNNICLATAIDVVLACCKQYKLPETTRWADAIASNKKCFRDYLKNN